MVADVEGRCVHVRQFACVVGLHVLCAPHVSLFLFWRFVGGLSGCLRVFGVWRLKGVLSSGLGGLGFLPV